MDPFRNAETKRCMFCHTIDESLETCSCTEAALARIEIDNALQELIEEGVIRDNGDGTYTRLK